VLGLIHLILTIAMVISVSLAPSSPAHIPEFHTVYLPLTATPPCTGYTTHLYISVNEPVVQVGEPFTITSVLVNDGCANLGQIVYVARIYSPTGEVTHQPGYITSVAPQGEDRQQWVFTLDTAGEYTLLAAASFEAHFDTGAMWGGAESPHIVMRVR
jgi:hypothetical protein